MHEAAEAYNTDHQMTTESGETARVVRRAAVGAAMGNWGLVAAVRALVCEQEKVMV